MSDDDETRVDTPTHKKRKREEGEGEERDIDTPLLISNHPRSKTPFPMRLRSRYYNSHLSIFMTKGESWRFDCASIISRFTTFQS